RSAATSCPRFSQALLLRIQVRIFPEPPQASRRTLRLLEPGHLEIELLRPGASESAPREFHRHSSRASGYRPAARNFELQNRTHECTAKHYRPHEERCASPRR